MRGDIIQMSQKERQRYHLLKMVVEGKTTVKEASRLMGVSCRQAKRLKTKLNTLGAKGLAHGNRGRPSPKALNRVQGRSRVHNPRAIRPTGWFPRAFVLAGQLREYGSFY